MLRFVNGDIQFILTLVSVTNITFNSCIKYNLLKKKKQVRH